MTSRGNDPWNRAAIAAALVAGGDSTDAVQLILMSDSGYITNTATGLVGGFSNDCAGAIARRYDLSTDDRYPLVSVLAEQLRPKLPVSPLFVFEAFLGF